MPGVSCAKGAIEYSYISIIADDEENPSGPADDNGFIGPLGADAQRTFNKYLENNSEEYRRLQGLRKKARENGQSDGHSSKQREIADPNDDRQAQSSYNMMKDIADDLDWETNAWIGIPNKPETLLDMCAAPGGFVDQTLARVPTIRLVRAMSLPVEKGGVQVRLKNKHVNVELRDITMLAGDMGIRERHVPENFPDRDKLNLYHVFHPGEKYDLIFFDGQAISLDPRSAREATRLTVTQAALGLQHLSNGGTMVVLMQNLDNWRTFEMINQFALIGNVELYKHPRHHHMQPFFYLIVNNVNTKQDDIREVVQDLLWMWKKKYRIATFGNDEAWKQINEFTEDYVTALLRRFGKAFVQMGNEIWKAQADELETVSWVEVSRQTDMCGSGSRQEEVPST